jgi:hypothetical protein
MIPSMKEIIQEDHLQIGGLFVCIITSGFVQNLKILENP